MGENSKIEWTDHTFNPWIGCQHVSPGCDHCYAEAMMDRRYGKVNGGRMVSENALRREIGKIQSNGTGRLVTSSVNMAGDRVFFARRLPTCSIIGSREGGGATCSM